MAVYRYQVVCVGLWRGKIKRWNTTFHAGSSTYTTLVYNMMQSLCYPNPSDVAGDCSGGIASITVYNSTGGAPIAQTTYFDYEAPSTWIPFTGTAWSGVVAGTPIDASGESAMIVQSLRTGLSASGKPVYIRKYIHAVPSRTAADFADPDISPANVTSLQGAVNAAFMLTPSGVGGGAPEVLPYYGNHQRVRGRRRTTSQVAAQAFSFGVLAGGGATTSGQGEPFPGGEY